MFSLDKLSPLVKPRKRIGRGGKLGGTSGKGSKGQKARSGGSPRPGFEGGQMPLYRRLPKRGFNNKNHQLESHIINLIQLNNFFNDGEIITKDLLIERKIIKPSHLKPFQLKILGDGVLSKKLVIYADKFSKSALEAIKKSGSEARLLKDA